MNSILRFLNKFNRRVFVDKDLIKDNLRSRINELEFLIDMDDNKFKQDILQDIKYYLTLLEIL